MTDTPGRTSRTVQVGDKLTMSDVPLGTVVSIARWQSRPDLDGWSATLTFDDGRTLTLTPGTYLPLTIGDPS